MSPTAVNSSVLRPALFCFLLAATLRVGWILARWHAGGARLDWPDEELHWQIALNLANSGAFVTDDGRQIARMPLYPLFLAVFANAGELGVLLAKLAQGLLSAVIVPIGVQLARRVFDARAAWLCGLLLALDPFAIFFCNLLLTETLFAVIAIALLSAAWRAADAARLARPTIASWGLVGLLAAAAILTRQSSVVWAGPLLIVLACFNLRRRRGVLILAAQLVIIGLLMLPWGLRNKLIAGNFAWLSANGGVTLYDSLGPQADGSSNQAFLTQLAPQLAGLTEIEQDRLLGRLAWEAAARDPLRVSRLAGTKFARMWNPFPNVAEHRSGAAAWAGAAYTVVTLGLAGVCLIRFVLMRAVTRGEHLRRAPRSGRGRGSVEDSAGGGGAPLSRSGQRTLLMLAWLPIVLFTLLHCVYIGSVRYRVPLMPLLAVAGCGVFTATASKGEPAGQIPPSAD